MGGLHHLVEHNPSPGSHKLEVAVKHRRWVLTPHAGEAAAARAGVPLLRVTLQQAPATALRCAATSALRRHPLRSRQATMSLMKRLISTSPLASRFGAGRCQG